MRSSIFLSLYESYLTSPARVVYNSLRSLLLSGFGGMLTSSFHQDKLQKKDIDGLE